MSEPFFFTWSKQRGATGLEIVGGEGPWFDTADGARWLDFGSLIYSANLGHGHPRMIRAIKAQADRLCLAMPQSVFPEKRALAEKLLALAGEGFTKVFFTLGGSEANENAIKMARLATGRFKVLSRYRSYHGATMGALSLTGDYRRPPLEPALVGAIKAMDCYCDRCPFGQEVTRCARECATQIDEVLRIEANVAAVFLEPVPGANGVLVPPDDYWPRVRAACDRHGALLVADEVLTGFGRCGHWLTHQRWGVTPDMITISKALTGGYGVLGAVLVHDRVARTFEDHALLAGLTQYAHPLGVAAALEALAIYEEEGLVERAARLGPALAEGLAALREAHPRARFSRGLGLLGALELDLDADGFARLGAALRTRRVHLFLRPTDRALIVAPPLCIDEATLSDGLDRIGAALAEVA
ncbi:MAG: aminotransferase class III-fold pyridoxal phosphate-dependent enzyme [Sandaracinaceae bacterium]|nr:aminotransferase class III-fold pyridoxal phosphate-dependent enzyme [Sandaracinaceae bacterium]